MTLEVIRSRMAVAAESAGRSASAVTLIAVSKVQPLDRVTAVLEQGQRVFGENKVQEAQGKWPNFRAQFGAVDLHLIGPLQTNKARAAMDLFDAIHTVDRPKLVTTLARLAQDLGRCPHLFVQVNTGAEPQKAGVLPQDTDSLIQAVRDSDLPLSGLMCIPPADADPAPHFAMLRDIAARNGLTGLSMGMSSDFETAIAYGATHIRVGSAIFGERTPA
ncbi:YggS family pyridoxal phosphate-dependent enzyme [Loktanella sp. DJP18]|uniref:YggS family pyridoxal phosphate-dependent enzyme n=1 Tax=Loktanella sp. DJP18 TaxID=3409788 RepID=UPI003BB702A8